MGDNHSPTATLSPLTAVTMSFQRVGLRFAQQMRAPALRRTLRSSIQRRFASAHPAPPGQAGTKMVGTQDNAFNRERAAVKAHAAATSDLWRRLSLYVVIPCLILGSITPGICGTNIGNIGNICLLWKSALNTHTRTSERRTSSSEMVTRPSSGTIRSTTTRRTSRLKYKAEPIFGLVHMLWGRSKKEKCDSLEWAGILDQHFIPLRR